MTTQQLTDLQTQLYALLIEHRYYNAWTKEPTVALQQNWLAQRLGVKQSEISTALAALRQARLITRCGTAALARPQIYFLTGDEIPDLADTRSQLRAIRDHIDPDPEQVRNTASAPLGRGENSAYEIE